jgi:hypothetical protein
MANSLGYGLVRIKNSSGAWSPLKGLNVKTGGAWAPCKFAYMNVNGVWEQVYPTPAGVATVSPISLAFTDVYTTKTSTAQTVTVTNTGTEVLSITGVTVNNTTNFSINHSFTTTVNVNPSASTSFTVNVTGATVGAGTGSLVFATSTGALGTSSFTVPVTANTIPLYATLAAPASISLTSDSVANRDPQIGVTLTNSGPGVLNISSITSNNSALVVSNVPTSIAANGGTATFTLKFTHTGTAGLKSYTITVNSNSTTGAAIQIPVSVGEIIHGTATFSNAGYWNWTVPYGITSVNANMLGAGGGGGGATANEEPTWGGSGGGGGATEVTTITVDPAYPNWNILVGGGGAGGAVGQQGSPGGNSGVENFAAPRNYNFLGAHFTLPAGTYAAAGSGGASDLASPWYRTNNEAPGAWGGFISTYGIWQGGTQSAGPYSYSVTLDFPTTGNYVFTFSTDNDGYIQLDGTTLMSTGSNFGGSNSTTVSVTAGSHVVNVSAHNSGGPAGLAATVVRQSDSRLLWRTDAPLPGQGGISGTSTNGLPGQVGGYSNDEYSAGAGVGGGPNGGDGGAYNEGAEAGSAGNQGGAGRVTLSW